MNSSAMLDSAVFQLTPTRTRFDLVITVNGKKERIASGLLSPFLSHLKAAQDQMAKGGYSIVLVPDNGSDATWFTRGTIERFVRFVSTPEILERVYTIGSEILQIEEAIAIQGSNSIGISTVEENQIKQVESTEGRKAKQDSNEEKAIVPYKSSAHPPEANGSMSSEGNSKVQLLKVLETRKSVLQKEQGMAFARAVAAGFDIDHMPALMSFAECFEASRLMDACRNFMSLWKRKHESGLWLEIDTAEVTPNRADFSAINTSGIVLSNNTVTTSHELDSENNGKAHSDVFYMDRQPTADYQDNIQGQFHQHGFSFSPWPIHSPRGALPVFQSYPVQGVPYFPTYPGNSPFMQQGCPPMEDPRLHAGQSMGHRRHSMDNRHNNTESETWDVESSKTSFWDVMDMEKEGLQTEDRRKKASRSGRQKVVIRNINYITKKGRSSGSGSYSDPATETDEDENDIKESVTRLNSSDKEEIIYGKDSNGGHWQAFQNYLLRGVDEDKHAIDQDRFEVEKVDHVRRKKHVAVNDPLDFTERDMHDVQGGDTIDMHSISKGLTRLPKSSSDELLLSRRRAGQSGNGRSVDDVQSLKIDGKGYLKHIVNDDSYIVENRSVRVNDPGNIERNSIYMDSEFPKVHTKEEKRKFSNYQPDELSLMPERGAEKGSMGYDPALDYEMQAQAEGGSSQDKKNKGVLVHTKPGSKMLDKEQKSKPTPNSSDRRKTVGPIRRGKTNKPSPLDEARARAERLRNYKADLQKMKKEKEEEEIKRLEALKKERQKRIAARSSSHNTKSPMPSQQTKKQFPTKFLPGLHKGSKFSDSVPGSSSPFQRFPIRTASPGSNESSKVSKTSRLNAGSHSVTSKLSRSVPSLPVPKQEKGDTTTDPNASNARIRRFSEPKMSTIRQTSSVKPRGSRTISKTKAADETERRKLSAIVNHDKSKIATLPELKIRISKASDIVQDRSSIKEKTQNLNGNKPSMDSEGALIKRNEIGISSTDDGDDNPIIEKTVVMLECEKPCAPNINDDKSREKTVIAKRQYDNDKVMDKTETVSGGYVAVRAPVSSLSTDVVDIKTLENQSQVKSLSTKVKMNNTEQEPSKSSSTRIAEETHRGPYARVSSLEDRCTRNSEHGKAPPTSLETASIGMETFRAHVLDTRNLTLEKIPEVNENPQVKDSSKGLRWLLKFGRKNHNSATAGRRNVESDNANIDGFEANEVGASGSSNEVHTLKNLLSRDETPSTNATPQKSTRTFSLLSPFRSNSREKKTMMA